MEEQKAKEILVEFAYAVLVAVAYLLATQVLGWPALVAALLSYVAATLLVDLFSGRYVDLTVFFALFVKSVVNGLLAALLAVALTGTVLVTVGAAVVITRVFPAPKVVKAPEPATQRGWASSQSG